jgi:hypothetical protein
MMETYLKNVFICKEDGCVGMGDIGSSARLCLARLLALGWGGEEARPAWLVAWRRRRQEHHCGC